MSAPAPATQIVMTEILTEGTSFTLRAQDAAGVTKDDLLNATGSRRDTEVGEVATIGDFCAKGANATC